MEYVTRLEPIGLVALAVGVLHALVVLLILRPDDYRAHLIASLVLFALSLASLGADRFLRHRLRYDRSQFTDLLRTE